MNVVPPVSRFPTTSLLICASIVMLAAVAIAHQQASDAGPRGVEYVVYVVSEAADRITRLRFGPSGGKTEREITTGLMPTDVDGPHGLAVAPDGQFYYVTLGHGQPFGWVLKYSARDDRVLGQTMLGSFPASMDLTPDGNLLFIVNFNLHGDMVPSSVSVVATDEMLEVKRIPTCTMPHGSRVSPRGTAHYSACMMDDLLVEIDTRSLSVSRHFVLTAGHEAGMNGAPLDSARGRPHAGAGHSGEVALADSADAHKDRSGACSPTWAQPSADGASVFVACNQSNEIVEVDTRAWMLRRRIRAGAGVYNLTVTKTGRLVATNKRDQSVSIFDVSSGRELGRVKTTRPVVHGVVATPDGRFAFVSVEGTASDPGTVEMIDLAALTSVARVDIAPQAAGLDLLGGFQAGPAPP